MAASIIANQIKFCSCCRFFIVFTITLLFLNKPTKSSNDGIHCESAEFQCSNGQCILQDWRCDLDQDCTDGSDENAVLCSNVTCRTDYFSCQQNGVACIPQSWRCDGHADCPNGSDENNCEARQCTEEEFRCVASNLCISARWRCDQDDDCDDNSDEKDCEQQVCSNTTHFACGNGRCIPLSWHCDGDNDCSDHSDELHCDVEIPGYQPSLICHGKSKEFMCSSSRECIHWAWRCDGEKDCLDGSDENLTMCGIKSCSSDHFQCHDGSCISKALTCDHFAHCVDGSDESNATCRTERRCSPRTEFDCTGSGEHCINVTRLCDGNKDCDNYADENAALCNRSTRGNHCSANNGGCSHNCTPTRVSYYCSCPNGYVLGSDDHTCVDIDECLNPSSCSHICENTAGSFTCRCHKGYRLSPRDHRCRAGGEEPMLLYGNRHDIRMMGLHSRHHQSLIDELHSAVAIDYDYSGGNIYWSDVALEKIMWTSLQSNAVAHSLIDKDISTPDGLAVDWIHKNLYWTDTGNNRIEVISLKNPEWRRVVIKEDLDEPRAIVVDPRADQRYMYWSDWGDAAKIERASLDGTDRKTVINSNLQWPNGLTIDYETNKLFWIDAKLHLIGASDLNGSNQQVILMSTTHIKHPFAITVFEDSVYWSDWESESILRASKYPMARGGSMNVTRVVAHVVSPMDVCIYHQLRQPIAEDACVNAGCNQLCLPSHTQHRCYCSDRSNVAYMLKSDGKTCVLDPNANTIRSDNASTTGADENFRQVTSQNSSKAITKFAVLGVLAAIAFASSAIGVGVLCFRWYRQHSNKILNFDNPVYRRTTTDGVQFSITHRHQQPKLSSSLTEPLTSSMDSDVI